MAESYVLTGEGYAKLQKEKEDLIQFQRPEIEQKLKEARAQGDLSENAEYDAAKARQGEIESRIADIDRLLNYAKIINDEDNVEGHVSLGNTVLLHDVEFDEDVEYKIVGSTESNPSKGWISNESPVGKALLGVAEGETVKVQTPGGEVVFIIKKISND